MHNMQDNFEKRKIKGKYPTDIQIYPKLQITQCDAKNEKKKERAPKQSIEYMWIWGMMWASFKSTAKTQTIQKNELLE